MARYSLLQPAAMDYFTRQALDSCITYAIRCPHVLFSYNGGDLDLAAIRPHGLGTISREISAVERWLDAYVDVERKYLGFVDIAYRRRTGRAIIQVGKGLPSGTAPPGAQPLTGRVYFTIGFGIAF
jgi:hypothetical protein